MDLGTRPSIPHPRRSQVAPTVVAGEERRRPSDSTIRQVVEPD
jgi:hypothetical protein